MASIEDIISWEQRLQQELDGLKYCLQKVAADSNIPQAIKTRFRDIVAALNDNIYQVLGRCNTYSRLSTQVPATPHRKRFPHCL